MNDIEKLIIEKLIKSLTETTRKPDGAGFSMAALTEIHTALVEVQSMEYDLVHLAQPHIQACQDNDTSFPLLRIWPKEWKI